MPTSRERRLSPWSRHTQPVRVNCRVDKRVICFGRAVSLGRRWTFRPWPPPLPAISLHVIEHRVSDSITSDSGRGGTMESLFELGFGHDQAHVGGIEPGLQRRDGNMR